MKRIRTDHPDSIKIFINSLNDNQVIVYPTDTIWGIGCDACCDTAVKKVFEIKRRDHSKPLICLASSFERVGEYVEVSNLKKLKSISEKSPTTFIFNNPNKISKYANFSMYLKSFSLIIFYFGSYTTLYLYNQSYYSIFLWFTGEQLEGIYVGLWPVTILGFAIAIRQRRNDDLNNKQ